MNSESWLPTEAYASRVKKRIQEDKIWHAKTFVDKIAAVIIDSIQFPMEFNTSLYVSSKLQKFVAEKAAVECAKGGFITNVFQDGQGCWILKLDLDPNDKNAKENDPPPYEPPVKRIKPTLLP